MKFLHQIRALFRKEKLNEALSDELAFHLEKQIEQNIAAGMSAQEARSAALRSFGGVEQVKEECRDAWGLRFVDTLLQDIRFGLRMLVKSPGFTAVAVGTLALGIGANTAIFSLINAVMLRMLPVSHPGQLVELLHKYPAPDEPRMNGFSWQSYEHFRDNNQVFSGLIGFMPAHFAVRSGGQEAEAMDGEYVVGDYFPVLGMKPAIGRLLGPDDQKGAGGAPVVVSWSYWQSRYNLDRGILGKQIMVADVPLTIVGVAPRDFFGFITWSRPSLWVPMSVEPLMDHSSRLAPGHMEISLIGRLKPGVSMEQASAEMRVLFQFTVDEISRNSKDPLWRQLKFELSRAGAGVSTLRDNFAQPLLFLMALVGLLLLIACTNLASMLLARAAIRQSEMALRLSLGAGRFRLMRQVFTESLLLSVVGGLLGIFVAYWGAAGLMRIITSGRRMVELPPHLAIDVKPDAHVLLFTAGIALFTGLLFGLAPAWSVFVSTPASSLRETGHAGGTRFQRIFGKSLVVAQVAFSVVLLSAAGLFVGHLWNLQHRDLGFRRDHVLLVTLDSRRSELKGEQLSRLYQNLLGRMESIPGVHSATMSTITPISGSGASSFANVEGHAERPQDRRYVGLNWVAPKYFQTLGTPLLAGRDFTAQDQSGPLVAIVNQAFARYYFAGGNPIGKHFWLDKDWKGFGPDRTYEIVGMVGDAKYTNIDEVTPRTIYFHAFQDGNAPSQVSLWTSVSPAAVAPQVRRVVGEAAKSIQVAEVTTLRDQVDASIVPERLIATLSGSFGALGSLLAVIGLYGLLAYMVARRVNEIGIRMALGARAADVRWMVMMSGLRWLLMGLIIGASASFALGRILQSRIWGINAADPLTLIAVAVLLAVVGLIACYIPARRATKVDPMVALRYE
jgi:putative ABC transport system permease protein